MIIKIAGQSAKFIFCIYPLYNPECSATIDVVWISIGLLSSVPAPSLWSSRTGHSAKLKGSLIAEPNLPCHSWIMTVQWVKWTYSEPQSPLTPLSYANLTIKKCSCKTFFGSGLYLCHAPKFAARCSVCTSTELQRRTFLKALKMDYGRKYSVPGRRADGIFELGATKLSANDSNSISYFV